MRFGSLCLLRNLSISSKMLYLSALSHLQSSHSIPSFWMRALFCFFFLSPLFILFYLVVSRALSVLWERLLSTPPAQPMCHRCWDKFCPGIRGGSGHFSLGGQERLPGGGDASTLWTISRGGYEVEEGHSRQGSCVSKTREGWSDLTYLGNCLGSNSALSEPSVVWRREWRKRRLTNW